MSNKLTEIAEDSAVGGFFLFTGNVLSLIILTIGSIIIARLLGPANYGLLSLSIAVPSILMGSMDFGVDSALTRFSAKLRAEGKSHLAASMLKSGFLYKLVSGILVCAICFTFSDAFATYVLNRSEMGFLIKVASFLIPFQIIYMTLNSSFAGLDRMEGTALTMSIQSIVKTILSPLLIILGFSVVGAVIGYVTGFIIASVTGCLMLFLKYYKNSGKPSNDSFSSNFRTMLTYGFPLYLFSLLLLLSNQFRTIVLAFFTSDVEIGNFGIAFNMLSIMSVLTFPLGVLFPAFSKVNPTGGELKRIFTISVKYTALLIIPATILVAILSKDLVPAFYGSSYELAPLFLSVYVLTLLPSGLGSMVLPRLFNGIGETKVNLKGILISLIVFLPLAYMFTVLYGVIGMIIAVLISSLVQLAYLLLIAYKKIGVRPDLKASSRIYLTSFLSALPILALLHFSPLDSFLNVIISGSIYLFIYLTLIPLAGTIDETDFMNFQLIFYKIRVIRPIAKLLFGYENWVMNLHSKKVHF